VPEQIGFLKYLGLDYGWGPTAGMEWLLEHIHVLAGTPWWGSIILTTIFVRAVLFKAYMNASDNAAKLATIKPLTLPLTKEMQAAQMNGNTEKVMQLRTELQLINKRAGISIIRSFIPMLQVFTGYGMFVLLRGMSRLPVPGLETGGILWFHNLTIADPYLIMPIATAGVLHWVLRVRSDFFHN
jgi:YidC/Oxa1 family membrane protein insertase